MTKLQSLTFLHFIPTLLYQFPCALSFSLAWQLWICVNFLFVKFVGILKIISSSLMSRFLFNEMINLGTALIKAMFICNFPLQRTTHTQFQLAINFHLYFFNYKGVFKACSVANGNFNFQEYSPVRTVKQSMIYLLHIIINCNGM